MIKAIFFDSGDVIVKEGFVSGIKEYEKKYNLPEGSLYVSAHDRQYWKEFTLGNISEEEYLNSILNDYKYIKLNIEDLKEIIYKNFIPNTELLEFLKTIKKAFILGVISNHPKEWFRRCIKEFNWDEVFSIYVVSGNIHLRKPDRKMFEYAIAAAKFSPNECLYIDNRSDMLEGAAEVGFSTMLYLNNQQIIDKINTFNI